MNYDANVTSSVMTIDIKRRAYQVTFMRPQTPAGGALEAVCYLRQDSIDATSGEVLNATKWLVNLTKAQILSIPNAASFLNGLIAAIDDMKSELDSNGSVATGSVSQIM